MSSKTKNSRASPKGSARPKESAKNVLASPSKHDHDDRSSSSSSHSSVHLGLAIAGAVSNDTDVERIVSVQNKSLKSFAKTNERLGKFNDFSSSKYDVLQHMFLQHTRLLVDLKKDLTNVFLRIRRLKVKLQKQYPDAFEATFNLCQDLEKRLEDEGESKPTYVNSTKGKGKKGKLKSEKDFNEGIVQMQEENYLVTEVKDKSKLAADNGEIDLNSKHGKMHAKDETNFTNNSTKSEESKMKNDAVVCQEGKGLSDNSCDDDEHLEIKLQERENAKFEMSESSDAMSDKEGSKLITGDIKDLQVIENSTELCNPAEESAATVAVVHSDIKEVSGISEGIEGPQPQVMADVVNERPSEVVDGDLEATSEVP